MAELFSALQALVRPGDPPEVAHSLVDKLLAQGVQCLGDIAFIATDEVAMITTNVCEQQLLICAIQTHMGARDSVVASILNRKNAPAIEALSPGVTKPLKEASAKAIAKVERARIQSMFVESDAPAPAAGTHREMYSKRMETALNKCAHFVEVRCVGCARWREIAIRNKSSQQALDVQRACFQGASTSPKFIQQRVSDAEDFFGWVSGNGHDK